MHAHTTSIPGMQLVGLLLREPERLLGGECLLDLDSHRAICTTLPSETSERCPDGRRRPFFRVGLDKPAPFNTLRTLHS